ncbi:MAG: DNA recombination protein RmuC [Akkermansia sp.]|nr:DNA recombination protein RmuC [Akkermansia sp.]
MTELLYIAVFVVGGALGGVVAMLLGNRRLAEARLEAERTRTSLTGLQQLRDAESAQVSTLRDDVSRLQGEYTRTLSALERHKAALEGEQKRYGDEAARHEELREQHRRLQAEHTETLTALERSRTALEKEQQHRQEEAVKIKEMQEKHFSQFRNLAGEIMEQNAGKLKDTNRESMDGLLKPLRDQLESLGKAVTHTNETAAGNKASLETAIRAMMEKTESLGHDAKNLTLALRGNTKKQGDWGEMILERMLEESGLRKGEEYFVQENHKTEDGRDVRPDVIIRFPDERCVIVDSKVSLTAYALYAAAEKEEERLNHLNAHVSSVRKHIDELAGKDYSSIVEGTISYVLMFMPNEASYMAALQHSPELPMEAYRRRIILISPTNLLMALQLAYNLWQKERQTRNVEKIFDRATKLYDKMCLVQDSLEKVGKGLDQAQMAYTKACDQLYRGRGNYARQLDDLRQMGISPSKRLKLSDADEVEE